MALKFGAFLLTGSVGLLSDAAESSVNLVAALIAFTALTIADRPPDSDHTYGHDKAEYFSSGAEGTLILIAAAVIIYTAVDQILHPVPLEKCGGWRDHRTGRLRHQPRRVTHYVAGCSPRRQHCFGGGRKPSDDRRVHLRGCSRGCWAGRPNRLANSDPFIAIAVAIQIIVMGIRLLKRSMLGLMDTTLHRTR